MSEEITDLQTRFAFQEDAMQELSHTVVRQEREIKELQGVVEQLRKQLRALTPEMVTSPSGETLPPHY